LEYLKLYGQRVPEYVVKPREMKEKGKANCGRQ